MLRSRSIAIIAALLLTLFSASLSRAGGGVETAGDVTMALFAAGAAALIIADKDLTGAVQFAESQALSSAVTLGLKYTINESRPDGGSHSFPSWHSTFSFSSAEFIRKRYGWEYGIPAYALASFVAYSRVESDQHYAKDVIAGAAIGIVSSYLFTRPYQGMTIQPAADAGYYGVRVSRVW